MQFLQFTCARADTGAVLPRASVSVFQAGTSTLATLFASDGTAIANPIVANDDGLIGFSAADGNYDIHIVSESGAYAPPPILGQQLFDAVSYAANLAASQVAYGEGTVATAFADEAEARETAVSTLQAAIDKLNYAGAGGLAITGMTVTPAQAEIGSTVSPVVTWTTNRTPTAQTINGASATSPFNAPTATANTSYALAVTDANAPGGSVTVSDSRSIAFVSKAYWGVAPTTAPTDANLLAFSGSAFATARARSMTFDASAGGYPTYAWPASLGALSSVKVGGLAFSDYMVTTRNVVNAAGATVSMNILVFNTLQHGASIQVDVA